MEIACRQDVKPGLQPSGSACRGELRDYDIEIQKVDYNSGHKNKSMVIKVTDPDLITDRESCRDERESDYTGWKAGRSSDPCVFTG